MSNIHQPHGPVSENSFVGQRCHPMSGPRHNRVLKIQHANQSLDGGFLGSYFPNTWIDVMTEAKQRRQPSQLSPQCFVDGHINSYQLLVQAHGSSGGAGSTNGPTDHNTLRAWVVLSQALQWLHNEPGQLPAHAPVSRRQQFISQPGTTCDEPLTPAPRRSCHVCHRGLNDQHAAGHYV